MRLPVTLSVVRAAVISIAGETYALALSRLERIDRIARSDLKTVEGRLTTVIRGETVGLVHAMEILELKSTSQTDHAEELSVVSSPYEVNGQVVGTLGVIGPTRMPYERMIQIVDITSRLVSNALSHQNK